MERGRRRTPAIPRGGGVSPWRFGLQIKQCSLFSANMSAITIHYVKSDNFDSADFDNKTLRRFCYETPQDIRLRLGEVRSDGSFVVYGTAVGVFQPVDMGDTGRIDIVMESIGQSTVDKMKKAGGGALLEGCNFVIFEESPKAAALCGC